METALPTIKTATISVKVMRIDNRQMTLSVFRQLPNRDLIDIKGRSLRGAPWGTVNYSWDGCWRGSDLAPREIDACSVGVRPHFHVVWQEGGRLFRSCVPFAIDNYVIRETYPELDFGRIKALNDRKHGLLGLQGITPPGEGKLSDGTPADCRCWVCQDYEVRRVAEFVRGGCVAKVRDHHAHVADRIQREFEQRVETLRSYCFHPRALKGKSPREAILAIGAEVARIKREDAALRDWWEGQAESLQKLDQLFIAT